MLIDTHSHIYDSAFDDDRDEVLIRASSCGVAKIILPAVDSASHEALFELANKYPDLCLPMIGFHPTSVNDNANFMDELRLVEKYLNVPPAGVRFCGIGEIGLDMHWSRDFLEEQKIVFREQLNMAVEWEMPVVVHTRDCWDEMCELLAEYKGSGLRGVMHSFSAGIEHYDAIKAVGGFYFGIGGPVTYKNSKLVEVVSHMELSDILLETDSPYLPPAPYRGKRNESSYITNVCEKVAEIKQLQIEEVARICSDNAMRLFKI